MNIDRKSISYKESWKKFRRWQTAFWFVVFSFFPIVGGVGFGIGQLINNTAIIIIPLFFIWGIIFFISMNVLQGWRCPRCNNHFFFKSLFFRGVPLFLVKSCRHCGLSKYADNTRQGEGS